MNIHKEIDDLNYDLIEILENKAFYIYVKDLDSYMPSQRAKILAQIAPVFEKEMPGCTFIAGEYNLEFRPMPLKSAFYQKIKGPTANKENDQ